jgi:hypothetical protein
MSWRDDLPDIPTERIRREVMSEGGARRAAARRRRNSLLTGAGLAAVVVLGVAGLIALDRPDDDDGDAASTGTAPAAAATAAATETTLHPDTEPEATTGGTEAPADTAASEATEAAEATVPFVAAVVVEPTTVWEVPPGGAAACGPVTFEVTATAPGARRAVAIVRSTGGLRVEREMALDGDRAAVVFDGFPAATVEPDSRVELFVEVVATDAAGGVHSAAGPEVELVDCGS